MHKPKDEEDKYLLNLEKTIEAQNLEIQKLQDEIKTLQENYNSMRNKNAQLVEELKSKNTLESESKNLKETLRLTIMFLTFFHKFLGKKRTDLKMHYRASKKKIPSFKIL